MCQYYRHKSKKNNLFRKSVKELSLKEISNVVDRLPFYSLITFTGGEPFLRKDIMDILEISSRKRKVHIITNGTLIDKNMATNLAKIGSRSLLDKGLVSIGISLHGKGKKHDETTRVDGTFKKVLSTIKFIVEMKKRYDKRYPFIHTTTVITNNNVEELSDIFELS